MNNSMYDVTMIHIVLMTDDSYCFDDNDRNTEFFHENQIGACRQCLN